MFGAVAPAGANWTAAQTLSRPHAFVAPSGLGYARGDGLAVWNWTDDDGGGGGERRSTRPIGLPGGRVPVERDLPAGTAAGPVVYGSGRVIIATQTDRDGRATLRVRHGTIDGRFGRSVAVARARSIYGHRLVGNAYGDAALGWLVSDGTGSVRVFVSARRRGGAFGVPILLGRGRIVGMTMSIGLDGGVLVAWNSAGGIIRARVRGGRERAFHRVEELPARPAVVDTLKTAVDDAGGAWIAWSGQSFSGESEAFVELARRPAGSTRFRPARLLERAKASVPSAVSLAIGVGRIAVLAWLIGHHETGRPSRTDVRAAQTDAHGATRTDTLASFAAVDSEDMVLAAARYGSAPGLNVGAAVLWTQRPDPGEVPTPLLASVRAPAQLAGPLPGWGAPELVTTAADPMASIALAYPGGGDALVALFAHRRADGRAVLQHSIRR